MAELGSKSEFTRTAQTTFPDPAVMEQSNVVAVVPAALAWIHSLKIIICLLIATTNAAIIAQTMAASAFDIFYKNESRMVFFMKLNTLNIVKIFQMGLKC